MKIPTNYTSELAQIKSERTALYKQKISEFSCGIANTISKIGD